ncbi:MAG: bifunctional phosphoribosyl-AMP cyclohydrolase/phosphoribosyl-ATP diphosphatase HisIE [Anaerolineales bacterium]|nr:bifunctional phosphoribosyl-AMP cyclohydrolase/phosphoribosyl-ATP diphosphatase HisIE [Anaerolineales bacterium]
MDPQYNEKGLVPAIAQDARTGEVLMLAWMNAEAWRKTLETRDAYFWSRERKELWRKGATSGNTLKVEEVRLDCDTDAILLKVIPAGPACHTGERSCFFNRVIGEGRNLSNGFLSHLEDVIADRKINPDEGSYTSALFREGLNKISQKVGEEATETIVAALGQSDDRVVSEVADLLYHTLVLLAARGLTLADVEAELERRHA